MKKIGYILLLIASYLILSGGIADVVMTFFISSLPKTHLNYLKIKDKAVFADFKNLDYALLRAIGGCLIGIGIAALTITYSLIRKNIKGALTGLIIMITIAEGINASQMFLINSPYFIFPLACVCITWLGAIFWSIDKKK